MVATPVGHVRISDKQLTQTESHTSYDTLWAILSLKKKHRVDSVWVYCPHLTHPFWCFLKCYVCTCNSWLMESCTEGRIQWLHPCQLCKCKSIGVWAITNNESEWSLGSVCLFLLKRNKFCILGKCMLSTQHLHIYTGLQAAEGVHHCPSTNGVHLSRLLEDGPWERV